MSLSHELMQTNITFYFLIGKHKHTTQTKNMYFSFIPFVTNRLRLKYNEVSKIQTVKKALLLAKSWTQKCIFRRFWQIIQNYCNNANNQWYAPSIYLIDAKSNQFLTFFQRCRTKISEIFLNGTNKITCNNIFVYMVCDRNIVCFVMEKQK